MNLFSLNRTLVVEVNLVQMIKRPWKVSCGYSLQEHSGMSFLSSMEPTLHVGDDSDNGNNREYGRIYGRNFLLSLINRRNLRGK